MWIEALDLKGQQVELQALQIHHAAELAEGADLAIFAYMTSVPKDLSVAAFQRLISDYLSRSDSCYFAICFGGVAVGVTAYLDIRAAHRGLEIGSTWINPTYWGTQVNPEAKYLLLRHAFETLGAIRVQLKTDSRNLHSQKAIEKLGASKEGVLRNHLIMPDGYIRDTVMYSITPAEWEGVKLKLQQRLGYPLD